MDLALIPRMSFYRVAARVLLAPFLPLCHAMRFFFIRGAMRCSSFFIRVGLPAAYCPTLYRTMYRHQNKDYQRKSGQRALRRLSV